MSHSSSHANAFQSTSLSRGKTFSLLRCHNRPGSFNPLPSHEGRRLLLRLRFRRSCLSIHFPLTREDMRPCLIPPVAQTFNPLPSHEGRPREPYTARISRSFQSTSLSRGKTSPCVIFICGKGLSIHFPLTREDQKKKKTVDELIAFQSTSLSRGKTSGGSTALT